MDKKFGIELQDLLGIKTPENVASDLLQRMRERRKRMKMSRARLAQLSGVKEPTIRRAETTGKVSLVSLLKMAMALECLDDFKEVCTKPHYNSIEEVIAANEEH